MLINRTTLILLLGINLALGQTNGFCNLVWSDDFNGPNLSSDWTKEQTCYGGGNNELQCYTARSKNVFIDNGSLVLRAFRETYTGSQSGCTDSQGCTWTQPYTSGRVNTASSHSWLYGRFEARAKVTKGTHLWPAFWMLPTDWAYGGWAASGEIDIMEQRGDLPYVVSGTVHHGAPWPNNVWSTTGDHGIGVDLSADYHVYALEWTSSYLKWYIDNTLTQSYDLNRWWNSSQQGVYWAKGQPFDRRFHMILNLAVGGGFFNGYPALTDAGSAQWAQPEMRVDYVKVWSQGGNCNAGNTPTTTTTTTTTQATQATQGNDQNNRPSSSATCNNQAYDAARYTCTINENGQQVLCQAGYSSCGGACYLSSQYCCLNHNLTPKSQCPAVTTSTTTTSTTTSTPATSSGSVVSTCNNQPFNPSLYTCATNEQGRSVLCPAGNSACGSACFSSTLYCCRNGALLQKSFC